MKNISAHLSLVGCNLIWACAYPIYSFVMPRYIEPLPLLTAILITTAIISLVARLLEGGESQHFESRDLWSIIIAALLIALLRKGMLLFGLSMSSPIDDSIIATVSPVVVLLLSAIVGYERFTRGKVAGIVLGAGGAVGVILSGFGSEHGSNAVLGNTLILMCAFITAIYIVWFKRLLQHYDSMMVLRWMFCIAAVVIAPIGVEPLLKVDPSGWSPKVWWAVGYLVVMTTYLPNILLTRAIKTVSPTITSVYVYLQPIVAVAISVAAGIDKLRPITALFAIVIFVGVGIVISTSNERK